MSPREILKKIIEERGSCDWVGCRIMTICAYCPLHNNTSCVTTVSKLTGGIGDNYYLQAAIKVLDELDVECILLGEHYDP